MLIYYYVKMENKHLSVYIYLWAENHLELLVSVTYTM